MRLRAFESERHALYKRVKSLDRALQREGGNQDGVALRSGTFPHLLAQVQKHKLCRRMDAALWKLENLLGIEHPPGAPDPRSPPLAGPS
jgi:hypothetical protein